jgi:hypothetical protein
LDILYTNKLAKNVYCYCYIAIKPVLTPPSYEKQSIIMILPSFASRVGESFQITHTNNK